MNASRITLILLAAAAVAAVVVVPTIGQTGASKTPTAGAVADFIEVFNNYERAKEASAQMNERMREIEAEDKNRGKKIDAVKMELESGYKPGSEQYEKRFADYQQMVIDRRVWREMQTKLVQRKHHRLSKQMYDEIHQMIRRVARDRGIDVVLFNRRDEPQTQTTPDLLREIESRKVLYARDGLDVTMVVLQRLNEAYKARQ